MDALGRSALDIRRLAGKITAFWNAPRQVAILYSRSSLIWSDRTENSMYDWYLGLCCLDTPIGFVSEDQIGRGELSRYRVLVVPQANYLPNRVYEKIEAFVRNGGTAVISAPSLSYDEHGHRRSVGSLVSARPPTADLDHPIVFGQGKVHFVDFDPGDLKCNEALDNLLTQAGVDRPVRVMSTEGRPMPGIEFRAVQIGKDKTLVYVLNRTATRVCANIAGRRPITGIWDLIENQSGITQIDIPPLGVRFLELDVN